jgi:hypothetical protein
MYYILSEQQLKKLFEQSDKALEPIVVRLFQFLNEEKKNHKTRAALLDVIKGMVPYLGLPEGYELYYLELYLLNYRKDGDYSNLTKENFVDPRKLKGKTTPNTRADLYTKTKLPFKGSNLQGYWTEDFNGIPIYVVYSYGWYPIYIFKQDKWYEIIERYSSSTGRQMKNANPVEWSEELDDSVILATKEEMKALTQKATYDDIMRNKMKKLKELEPELQSKKMSRRNEFGGWDYETETRLPGYVVKFKVNSIESGEDKSTVVVDVYDVLKNQGNKSLPTPENYLKGELPNVSKERVEKTIERKLKQDLRPFIGPRFRYHEDLPPSSKIQFRFNHLKK